MNYVGPQIQQATGASIEQLRTVGGRYEYLLQPLTSIHLTSHMDFELEPNGEVSSVYIFSSIAAAILLLAIINFMNLATARSEKRAREVGIRKALGSQRVQLITQFLAESVLMSTIAVCLAVGLVMLFIPVLDNLAGKELRLNPYGNLATFLVLLCAAAGVGVLAGVYPAFSLSSFTPSQMLKHGTQRGNRGTAFRNGLVVFQFTVSIILIVGTFIIRDQLGFMRSKNLGFTKEQVITIDLSDIGGSRLDVLKQELMKSPRVVDLSNTTSIPGRADAFSSSTYRIFDAPAENAQQLRWMFADARFVDTYRMTMSEGTFFDNQHAPGVQAAVINQAAVKILQLHNPVGSQLVAMGEGGGRYTIVGVVQDFNFESLRQPVRPLVVERFPEGNSGPFLSVRVSPVDVDGTLTFMKETWEKCGATSAFSYSFLDENLDALYKAEQRTTAIAALFSALAIIIACLGLFGLATFVAEQRTKEIGIRKVLGASVSDVVVLLTREFVKWVLVAMVIAWPVAYFVMDRWLQDFAYRMDIGLWSFVYAGALALAVAFLTVCGQAVKAALTNPVENLRYE
jgi:putative ABC transport system permease protein